MKGEVRNVDGIFNNDVNSGKPSSQHDGRLVTERDAVIQPKPIQDYSRFISRTSKNRIPSFPRYIMKCLESSSGDAVFLAGGLPNGNRFPIVNLSMTLRDGSQLQLGRELTQVGMQYGVTDGYKPLLDTLGEFVGRYHGVDDEKLERYKLIVTPGAQDALSKTIETILNEGDYVIAENAIYPGTIAALAAVKPTYLLVDGDGDGMKPESLRQVLTPWERDLSANGSNSAAGASPIVPTPPRPKLLIVCPSGGNPTGSCLTLERKWEIYRVAQRHDLLILEDDPYFFLQFGKERIPSFLSMDVDGRVIRTDSFSKIISSGMRLGFMVGPIPIVERVVMHFQVTIGHTPVITQMILQQILQTWGWSKFEDHVESTRLFYLRQKESAIALCEKYLSDIAEWEEPRGGMFVWIKIKGVPDTQKMCMERGFDAGIVVLPGSACSPLTDESSSYLRISYSLVSPDIMEKGLKRLRKVILKEVELQRN